MDSKSDVEDQNQTIVPVCCKSHTDDKQMKQSTFSRIITNLMIVTRTSTPFLSSYQSLSPSERQKDFSSDLDFASFTTHLISNSDSCITQQV